MSGRYQSDACLRVAERSAWREYILDVRVKRYNTHTMEFEYGRRKSNSNKEKYGINFEEAQVLWNDRFLVRIPSRQATNEEMRFLCIGLIGSNHLTAITTSREPDLTRIISVRRSRKQEFEIYAS